MARKRELKPETTNKTLRFNTELLERAEALAARQHRSLNNLIEYLLLQAIEGENVK